MTLDIGDLNQLGRDAAGEEMRRLLSELRDMAEVTQIITERFA